MATFRPPTEEEFRCSNAWGLLTTVDVHDCNPKTIRDADAVKHFTKELCARLDVKMFGETTVVDFGADPKVTGFSLVQLIETSLISGHFGDGKNTKFAYLDVFSCKYYDPQIIVDYAVEFFEGQSFNAHTILRGCEKFPEKYISQFAERNIILDSLKEPRTPVLSAA